VRFSSRLAVEEELRWISTQREKGDLFFENYCFCIPLTLLSVNFGGAYLCGQSGFNCSLVKL